MLVLPPARSSGIRLLVRTSPASRRALDAAPNATSTAKEGVPSKLTPAPPRTDPVPEECAGDNSTWVGGRGRRSRRDRAAFRRESPSRARSELHSARMYSRAARQTPSWRSCSGARALGDTRGSSALARADIAGASEPPVKDAARAPDDTPLEAAVWAAVVAAAKAASSLRLRVRASAKSRSRVASCITDKRREHQSGTHAMGDDDLPVPMRVATHICCELPLDGAGDGGRLGLQRGRHGMRGRSSCRRCAATARPHAPA